MSDALDTFLGLVRDTGGRVGESITAEQLADAEAVLDPHSSTPFHWLGRARGFSKTDDVAGLTLAVMLTQAPDRARCYAFAVDKEQAQLIADSAAGFIERSPEVRGAFSVESWKVVARHNGASLSIMAADAASTWGLRPYFAIADEIANWEGTGRPRRVFDAISSAMGKVPDARMVCITSAGDPASWQYRLREHARTDPLWRVSEIVGAPPWMPVERLEEQRRRLLPSMYARLFEDVWCASEDRLTTVEDLRACVGHVGDLGPEVGRRYVCSLDVGLVNDRTAAVVAHGERRPGGVTVVVDRVVTWEGTRAEPVDLSAVEAWVGEACREYRCSLVYDPFQAAHLTQRLRARGVRVVPHTFSQPSVGKLAVTMFNLLRDHALDLPDDDMLLDELANVRLRELGPGQVRMDHDPSRHDDMAVAVGMAASWVVERMRGSGRPASFGPSRSYGSISSVV